MPKPVGLPEPRNTSDKAVRFNLFTGEGGLADPQYTEDPEVISLCRTSFEQVWKLATPHDQITL